MILAITGHRLQKLGGYKDNPVRKIVQVAMARAFADLKPEKIVTGMALGVDQWAAALAIKMGIPFVAAVPCLEQETRWNTNAQDLYWKALKHAAEVVVVTKEPYAPWVMQKRNEWMIDNGDEVLAVWDGTKGGTANCVRYAQRRGKPIHRIVPATGERVLMPLQLETKE